MRYFTAGPRDPLVSVGDLPIYFGIQSYQGALEQYLQAGVLALLWFSHGVMVAWSREAERGYALAEVALALAVVFSANYGGLRARFARKRH